MNKIWLGFLLVIIVFGVSYIVSKSTFKLFSFCKDGVVYTNQTGILIPIFDQKGEKLICSSNEIEKMDFLAHKICIRGYLFQIGSRVSPLHQILNNQGEGIVCSF